MRLAALLMLACPAAWPATGIGLTHRDPIAPVILGVTGILSIALIGRFGARKLGLPSVLGELLMGIVAGNLAYLFGYDLIMVLREGPLIFDAVENILQGASLPEAAQTAMGGQRAPEVLAILRGPYGGELLQVAHTVDIFSRYGVIFLLFLVGLETNIEEMRQVGADSARVALIGMLMPFLLGVEAARLLAPEISLESDLFIGAALGATSVGITVRVLRDLRQSRSRLARTILGAAVFDDVLGLLLLAIVSGIVVAGGVDYLQILQVVVLACVFLVGALYLGPYFLRTVIHLLRHLDLIEAKMFVSYLFVMVLAWLANMSGLATIIGAFTAGLILHDAYFVHWGRHEEHPYSIKDLIMPLEVILVPIFFVLMGIQVKLEAFVDAHVLLLATGLFAAAVLGKLVCGFGVSKGINRLAIGAGMLPRGEVGLIFAAIGQGLGVINDELFASLVLVVVLTTLLAPPLLKFSLRGSPG